LMTEKSENIKITKKELSKDEKLDKLLWFKIFSSIIMGLLFGVLNFTGFFIFVLYFLLNTVLSFLYFSKYVTDEEVDYQSEIFTEGLNVSIPLFILIWILSYTIVNHIG